VQEPSTKISYALSVVKLNYAREKHKGIIVISGL